MVELTPAEFEALTRKADDKWAHLAREAMPAFFRLDLRATDTITLRADCNIAAGALQRVLAQLHGPCPDQTRVMVECQWILRLARLEMTERHGKKRRFRKANKLTQSANGAYGNAE